MLLPALSLSDVSLPLIDSVPVLRILSVQYLLLDRLNFLLTARSQTHQRRCKDLSS